MRRRTCSSCGTLLLPNGQGMPSLNGKTVTCNRREITRVVYRNGEAVLTNVPAPEGCSE